MMPPPKEHVVRIASRIPESLWRRARALAASRGMTSGQIVQEALTAYLGAEEASDA